MSSPSLPPLVTRPLRSRDVRNAVLAPELDRLLSPRGVDLMVTDQLEAIQVRVRAGLDVLERRLAAGVKVLEKRRLRLRLLASAGIVAGALGAPGAPGWAAPAPGVLLAIAIVTTLAAIVPLFATQKDYALLHQMRGRYDGSIERCGDTAELQAFAATVLAEATVIGVVPPLDSDDE